MTIFIGLAGKKQVGKDTAAVMLENLFEAAGFSTTITSFAEPMKNICVDVLGLSHEGAFGTDEQKNQLSNLVWNTLPSEIRYRHSNETELVLTSGSQADERPKMRSGHMTNREVMQIVGTDIFRTMLSGNVWAEAPFNKRWRHNVVIIADCRFPNEKEAIEAHGGVVLRLTRETGMGGDQHLSEIALDDTVFSHQYRNDGTLDSLESTLTTFVEDILNVKS